MATRRCCVCSTDSRFGAKGDDFVHFPKACLAVRKKLIEGDRKHIDDCVLCSTANRWLQRCKKINKFNTRKKFITKATIMTINKNTFVCKKHFVNKTGPCRLYPDPMPLAEVLKIRESLKDVILTEAEEETSPGFVQIQDELVSTIFCKTEPAEMDFAATNNDVDMVEIKNEGHSIEDPLWDPNISVNNWATELDSSSGDTPFDKPELVFWTSATQNKSVLPHKTMVIHTRTRNRFHKSLYAEVSTQTTSTWRVVEQLQQDKEDMAQEIARLKQTIENLKRKLSRKEGNDKIGSFVESVESKEQKKIMGFWKVKVKEEHADQCAEDHEDNSSLSDKVKIKEEILTEDIEIKDEVFNGDETVSSTPSEIGQVTENASGHHNQLLPEKSKGRYETQFSIFKQWCREHEVKVYTQNVLLDYFKNLVEKNRKSLWSVYSMLRSCLMLNNNVDISKFHKLLAYLKGQTVNYKPKKSKSLEENDIVTFVNEAPDRDYLLMKVALIIGVTGALRREDLYKILLEHVQVKDDVIIIIVPETTTNKSRSFAITRKEWVATLLRYLQIRMKNTNVPDRFFLRYEKGKCCSSSVGINTIGSIPLRVAKFLNLKDASEYTGHCFRRSSETFKRKTDVAEDEASTLKPPLCPWPRPLQ